NDIFLGLVYRFRQSLTLPIVFGVTCLSTPKLHALGTIKEPFGCTNGRDHFAFGALNLHPPSMLQDAPLFPPVRSAENVLPERRVRQHHDVGIAQHSPTQRNVL